jgi:hypothetical protein
MPRHFKSKALNYYYCRAYQKGFGKPSSLLLKIKLEVLGEQHVETIVPKEISFQDKKPEF